MASVIRRFLALVFSLVLTSVGVAAGLGKYLDDLVLKDVGDGRQFEVVSQYRYVDPTDTVWTVPQGTVVNGASIPRYLWSLVGGPWEGKYRNASVIHDYFFDRKQYESDSVHRVFYDAMIASEVPELKAKIMYFAVLRFNPRWKALELTKKPCPQAPAGHARYNCKPVLAGEPDTKVVYLLETPKYDEAEMKATAALIEAKNPALSDLEQLAKAKRGY